MPARCRTRAGVHDAHGGVRGTPGSHVSCRGTDRPSPKAATVAVLTAALATGVSGAFAVSLVTRFVRGGRRTPALLFWGVALVMFCTASLALLTGIVGGWTTAGFRTFYLFGGVLNVPWLALGSLAVNARSPAVSRWTGAVLGVVALLVLWAAVSSPDPELWTPAAVLAGAWTVLLLTGHRRVVMFGGAAVLVVYSVVAAVVVVTAPFVAPLAAAGLPEGAEVYATGVRGYAVGGNAVGAVTVITSALVSSAVLVWRRPARAADRLLIAEARRGGFADAIARWIFRGRTGAGVHLAHLVRGNLMIAAGVGIAAAGGVLSFLGDTVGHALGFTAGVIVMYVGFLRTTRPMPAEESAEASAS